MNNVLDQSVLSRCLDVLADDILPLTEQGVAGGNKVFGAALLRKSDLSLVLAETNNETENPLWHGEMHALKRFYEMPSDDRPVTSELIFLTSHEPCSLCLSAITWAGFDNFYYFFSHEDSRDSFAIPHDLKILKAVFDVNPGGYQQSNEFWTSYNLKAMMASVEDEAERQSLTAQAEAISARYAALSEDYQAGKASNEIPLN